MSDCITLPKNSFERIPPVEVGDTRPERIWLAVGAALSTWESTEDAFAYLFAFTINPITTSYAARRSYGKLMSGNSRRDLIEGSLEVFWRDIHKEAWTEERQEVLQNDCKSLIKMHQDAMARRNEFAHGIVASLPLGRSPNRLVLAPAFYNHTKRKIDLVEIYRHNSQTIMGFRKKFQALEGDVHRLVETLADLHHASRCKRPQ